MNLGQLVGKIRKRFGRNFVRWGKKVVFLKIAKKIISMSST